MRLPELRPALWLSPALAQVFLRNFRPVSLMRRRTTAPRSWLPRLESAPPPRYQNTVPTFLTLDDAFFSTKIAVHSGANAVAPFVCVALLDTGSPQTSIRRDVLDRMLSMGAASVAFERKYAPRSRAGFGESAPLQTSTSIRLSVQFFQAVSQAQCGPSLTSAALPSVLRGTGLPLTWKLAA